MHEMATMEGQSVLGPRRTDLTNVRALESRIKALAAVESNAAMERGALEGLLAAYRETTLVQHTPLFSEHPERAARVIDTVVETADAVKGGTAKGRILLVGAGPGDPGLLTVAAAKAIAAADVVLADRLVPTSILQLANGTVQVADKTPGRAHDAQRELDQAGLAALDQGKSVVRLKGGDPFVFGRGGEEARWYSSHGYNVGVIPGISSSIAAAACAGIPVTTRGVADRFVVATAHGRDGSKPVLPKYVPHCTYVFMMSVGRLGQLTAELMKGGFPTGTPVAVVQSGSTPLQRTLRSTVATVAVDATEAGMQAPSVIVIGEVVNCLDGVNFVPYPTLT